MERSTTIKMQFRKCDMYNNKLLLEVGYNSIGRGFLFKEKNKNTKSSAL